MVLRSLLASVRSGVVKTFRCVPLVDRLTMTSELPTDPYWKLRPLPPTPADETCHCDPFGPLLLRDILSSNPIGCFDCNGEVSPDRIRFSTQLAESIANWRSLHSSLYRLWLSSGDYESWARDRLLDSNGEVHRLGYEIVTKLNALPDISAYYWFFADTDSDAGSPAQCPKCSTPLSALPNGELGKCDTCRIVL